MMCALPCSLWCLAGLRLLHDCPGRLMQVSIGASSSAAIRVDEESLSAALLLI